MKMTIALVALAVGLMAFLGCTAGPNQMTGSPDDEGKVAGFWKGLWHGFIVLFSFIVSLFRDNVRIYEVHNNGGWYNFGYLLGIMMFFGGGGGGACKGAGRW